MADRGVTGNVSEVMDDVRHLRDRAERRARSVSTTHAAASQRVRASAANGRTHRTYHGIVQPSVRTATSITLPHARDQQRAAQEHGDARADDARAPERPRAMIVRTSADSPPCARHPADELRHAERRRQALLQADRGQVAVEQEPDRRQRRDARDDCSGHRGATAPGAEHDQRREHAHRQLQRGAADDRDAGAGAPAALGGRRRARGPRARRPPSRRASPAGSLWAPPSAVHEDQRVQARRTRAHAAASGPPAGASHHTIASIPSSESSTIAFHTQYAVCSGSSASG